MQVYNAGPGKLEVPGFEVRSIKSLPASLGGTTKATNFVQVNSSTNLEFFPALIIAVRGTASGIDWLVNTNHKLHESLELFVSIL